MKPGDHVYFRGQQGQGEWIGPRQAEVVRVSRRWVVVRLTDSMGQVRNVRTTHHNLDPLHGEQPQQES